MATFGAVNDRMTMKLSFISKAVAPATSASVLIGARSLWIDPRSASAVIASAVIASPVIASPVIAPCYCEEWSDEVTSPIMEVASLRSQ
jgi:hypothetical protein